MSMMTMITSPRWRPRLTRKLTELEARALAELDQRNRMAINVFRPQPHQDEIFIGRPKELLILGGNRSGKSTCASVMFAAMALDMPVTLSDGVTKIDMRLPHEKGECLIMWLVGFDQKHIGQSLHRMLFRAGLFKVIYDKQTKKLRAWQPWKDEDKELRDIARPSPPLIPTRCIVPGSWSWENRSNREFIRVQVKNPMTGKPTADIFAYSSKAEPKAGDPVSCIYIDEAIAHEEHFPEWQARLLDKSGRLFWASWPSVSNEALQKLSERCQESAEKGNGLFKEVRLTMSGNATLPKDDVDAFLQSCATDEDRMARDLGLFVTEQLRSYPLFDQGVHSALVSGSRKPDRLSQAIDENGGKPPHDWTRYLILDPGTQHPAVLLVAVPPPEFGDYIVPYEEIYPGRADPWQLAKIVRQKTIGQAFHRFIVDFRAARQTTLGMKMEMTVYDAYADAFEAEGLKCYMTGSRFEMGSDDVGGRIAIVRKWLHNDDKGFPKLRIVTHKCLDLCKQMKKVKKAVANKEESDERHAKGQTIDLVHTLEYAAAANLKYHVVRENPANYSDGYKWYLKKFGNQTKGGQPNISIGTKYVPR